MLRPLNSQGGAAAQFQPRRPSAFWRHDGGAFAIWLSLSMPITLSLVGAGVDYSRISSAHANLQAATDTAALASVQAVGQISPTYQQVASTYLADNYKPPAGSTAAVGETTWNNALNTVTVKATADVKTLVLGAVGLSDVQITAKSTAASNTLQATEVSMVLDTTGSMSSVTSTGNSRMVEMRKDAKQLVTDLMVMPDGTTNPLVKVSMVPFAEEVNIGTQYLNGPAGNMTTVQAQLKQHPPSWLTNVMSGSVVSDEATCVYPGSFVTTNYTCMDGVVANTCQQTTYVYDKTKACTPTYSIGYFHWTGCVATTPNNGDLTDTVSSSNPVWGMYWEASMNCASPMQRLTADWQSLQSQIDALTAYGETYLPEGLIWGWRALSPNAPFADGGSYASTRKVLVLMTDGQNTRKPATSIYNRMWSSDVVAYRNWANSASDNQTPSLTSTSNATTLQTCANIKKAGVTIYTIGLFVSDDVSKSVLKTCASDASKYYDASNISILEQAFLNIGAKLTVPHLVN